MNELEQLKRVLSEVAELRVELEQLRKYSSESSQISALPKNVQYYLYQVDETARETIEVLAKLNVELRKSLSVQVGSRGLTL